nr:DNA polymerase I [uncultured Blautia sp.]
MCEKILLIDGHSILNRAFYGLPDLMNSEGLHTGAVYGFLNILFKVLGEEKPEYLAVAFDRSEPTFRHEKYSEYKGTRKPMPEELKQQIPVLKEMLEKMGISTVSLAGYEADDILGTLAKKAESDNLDVTILSGDRDLLQLVTGKILVRLPRTIKGQTLIETYNEEKVKEHFLLTPSQIVDLKALMGDAADNIPGISGVGEKTATRLITEYGSVENAFAHVDEIPQKRARESLRENYSMAQLSKELAAIDTDCPVEFDREKFRLEDIYTKEAYELCRKLDFKNFLNRFDPAQVNENTMEQDFFTCSDFGGCEALFEKAGQIENVGVALLWDKEGVYGAGLALSQDEMYYIPVGGMVTAAYLGDKLGQLADRTLVCSMDVKAMLKRAELRADARVFDCGIAAYLLNPLKSTYAYEELAREYLNGKLLPGREELLGKTSLKKAWEEDLPQLEQLACYMAYTAYATRKPLEEKLQEKDMWKVYTKIELPLVFTLDSMEKWGIRVQGEELKKYGDKLTVRIQELEKLIWQQAGEEFNINSPKQLGVILFEKMFIPGGKKTKTGYSTSADILEKLAPEHPIVNHILEYRQLTKLKSTYADGLGAVIEADGRIHSTFNQTITATGRISSTEPNLQNIPVRMELGRLIRKVFVPEPGFVFLDADYSQIELRVLAHMSGDEKLIEAYKEAEDIHRLTASQVFHIPLDEVTPLQRRNAKAVNFGIVYGISSFGLSQDLSITRKEAAAYIQKYFETYPSIKGFLDRLVEQGKEKGYVTTMFGRRRPVPELKSSNFMQRSFGERVAMNSPIQGTAADIIKIAMNRVYKRLLDENLRSRLVLQVHDELLIETWKDEIPQVSQILEEEMKGAARLSVELEVDMHQGDNWYEAK